MIINVKGTKGGGPADEAESRERYELKERRLSKLPLAFGALILGVAAYLKAAMPSWSRRPTEDEPPFRPEQDDEPRLKIVDSSMLEASLEPVEQGESDPEAGPSYPIGSSGFLDWSLQPAQFLSVDEPSLSFPVMPIERADVSDVMRFGGPFLVANDNVPPVGRDTAGGTGRGRSSTSDGWQPERPPVRDDDDDEDDRPRTPVNRAPRVSGPVYLHDVSGCAAVLIGLSELLANATDPDGDLLWISNLMVSSGTITWTANGWLYNGSGLGPVTVTYAITDGKATIIQHAYFSVVRNSIIGTEGDDMLVGTACADDIKGLGGNDLIDGGAGDDNIVGGAGNDILRGGDGNDIILGGAGNDQISGGAGDDRLFGDDGNDTIFGDDGNDQISGGSGNDALFGGAGNDIISGDAGDDTIEGNDGDDRLAGGDGNDVISGGDGNDSIDGGKGSDFLLDGAGQDTVSGGEGDDHVVVALDGDRDTYEGGAGADTLDLSLTEHGVDVDLAQGSADGCEIGDNAVAGFEAVTGGSGADTLAGSNAGETLAGGAGDDRIDGHGGDDVLDGGSGDDVLHDGAGRDTVTAGDGNDVVHAAADGDDDFYDGGNGSDTLDYSASDNGIVIDLNAGTASGDDIGDDTISGFETVVGGSGDDHFVAGSQAVVVEGGAGSDTFEFTAPPASPAGPASTVLHAIVDFEPGDRIRMSKYDLFEEVFDELEDQFESIYGKRVDEDDARIRYRYERSETIDRTVIEADIDRDSIYETTIHLDGHRAIVIVEHA